MIAILDYGSQYTQLIARRIRGLGVLAEIFPPTISLAKVGSLKPDGIILSGGPSSVYAKGAPKLPDWVFDLDVPVLGICYGMQLMARALGGSVKASKQREYGLAEIQLKGKSKLFESIDRKTSVWMSHGDKVEKIPDGFRTAGSSRNCPIAVMANTKKGYYGIQFHPEVHHTDRGDTWLSNFLFEVCNARKDWKMKDFVKHAIETIREEVGNRRVISAVSGGVDSSVMAVLLHEAIGDQSVPIFVDNGLLRKNEVEAVQAMFKKLNVPLKTLRSSKRFLDQLKGIEDPERKRQIIGKEFIEVFLPHIKKNDMLAQGTLYPDVIESVSTKGPSDKIKTHHNRVDEVLALIEEGRVVEPLKELFKDEVRAVGKLLGIPKDLLWRHPFPGPGLAVRILGEVNKPRLDLLREADAILIEELKSTGHYDKIWQAFVVLLPVKSVGVMGDSRSYENVVAVRCITSTDGMTGDWYDFPKDVLGRISNRIINEIKGINRVTYDVSSKPPATIEWE